MGGVSNPQPHAQLAPNRQEEKGPAAKQIQLLGAAGNQAQQMKTWMWPTKGWGKGWAMPFPFMGMKGFDKGWGKGSGYGKGGKS